MYAMVMENFANQNLNVVVVKCWCLGFVVRDRTYVFSLYHNPDLNDSIFDCLLTSMVAMEADNVGTFFLFVGDLNGHQEWLDSMTTNHHGVVSFDLATVSGCDQLVCNKFDGAPTYACSGTLNLLMTDVPDLEWVAVVAP